MSGKYTQRVTCISVLILLISACGGGGGAASEPNSAGESLTGDTVANVSGTNVSSGQNGSASSVSVGAINEVIHTEDLVSVPEFDFGNNDTLSLILKFKTDKKAALKLCLVDSEGELSQDCLVSSRVDGLEYNQTILIGNDTQTLALQLIHLENPITTDTYYWNRDNSMRWVISL